MCTQVLIDFARHEKKSIPEPYTHIDCNQYRMLRDFGLPRTLRLDPAGAFRGQAVVDFCDREGIYLDHAPADAHWQIGVCDKL